MGHSASLDLNNDPKTFIVDHNALDEVLAKLQEEYHLAQNWWHPLVNDVTEDRNTFWNSLEKNENGSLDDSLTYIVDKIEHPESKLSEDEKMKLSDELFNLLDWGENKVVNQLEFEIVAFVLVQHAVHTNAEVNPFNHRRFKEWEVRLTRRELRQSISLRIIDLDSDEDSPPPSPLSDRNARD